MRAAQITEGLTRDAQRIVRNLDGSFFERTEYWGDRIHYENGKFSGVEDVEYGTDLHDLWLNYVPKERPYQTRDMVMPNLTAYGDYVGDTANIANYRCLREMLKVGTEEIHAGVYEYTGSQD